MAKPRKLPKAIRSEEWPILIKSVPSKHLKHKIAFLLAYGSGMRISEVLRCDREHFRGNSIFIPESKNGVERVVPVPKGWRDTHFKHLPLKLHIGARALQIAFKKYCKKCNLNPLYTFHSLRHGFATRLLESGSPVNHVQLLLGHSNLSTTSIYVRANPIDAIKSYEDLF